MAASKTASRRRAERIPASGPATIRYQGDAREATVRDVSVGGVFLFTDATFQAGAEIQVVLMLPRELGLDQTQMICCHGTIVRVEQHDGRYGVAAQIEKMEGLPQI